MSVNIGSPQHAVHVDLPDAVSIPCGGYVSHILRHNMSDVVLCSIRAHLGLRHKRLRTMSGAVPRVSLATVKTKSLR